MFGPHRCTSVQPRTDPRTGITPPVDPLFHYVNAMHPALDRTTAHAAVSGAIGDPQLAGAYRPAFTALQSVLEVRCRPSAKYCSRPAAAPLFDLDARVDGGPVS